MVKRRHKNRKRLTTNLREDLIFKISLVALIEDKDKNKVIEEFMTGEGKDVSYRIKIDGEVYEG